VPPAYPADTRYADSARYGTEQSYRSGPGYRDGQGYVPEQRGHEPTQPINVPRRRAARPWE
jgi:hypothetical protein